MKNTQNTVVKITERYKTYGDVTETITFAIVNGEFVLLYEESDLIPLWGEVVKPLLKGNFKAKIIKEEYRSYVREHHVLSVPSEWGEVFNFKCLPVEIAIAMHNKIYGIGDSTSFEINGEKINLQAEKSFEDLAEEFKQYRIINKTNFKSENKSKTQRN